ncbi:WW domain-containing protein [Stagonosporopsis vannaccii]|nr:WW domain-containing protein [Stagonosporopsis vannaccii]
MTVDNVKPSPAAPAHPSESTSHRSASPAAPPAEKEGAHSERSEGAVSDDNPPLPDEPVPDAADDGWDARWDSRAGAWYFFNSRTGVSQWQNPRVSETTNMSYASYDRTYSAAALPSNTGAPGSSSPPKRRWGGYNPAIHGSYDPNADYAKEATKEEEEAEGAAEAAAARAAGLPHPAANDYTAQAQFNRFTGKFQTAAQGPEMHNDENKSRRQMTAFFDVDAAANSHDGRSLKAERRGKTLTKKELKAYKEKRREQKEEKRRAWLRD